MLLMTRRKIQQTPVAVCVGYSRSRDDWEFRHGDADWRNMVEFGKDCYRVVTLHDCIDAAVGELEVFAETVAANRNDHARIYVLALPVPTPRGTAYRPITMAMLRRCDIDKRRVLTSVFPHLAGPELDSLEETYQDDLPLVRNAMDMPDELRVPYADFLSQTLVNYLDDENGGE